MGWVVRLTATDPDHALAGGPPFRGRRWRLGVGGVRVGRHYARLDVRHLESLGRTLTAQRGGLVPGDERQGVICAAPAADDRPSHPGSVGGADLGMYPSRWGRLVPARLESSVAGRESVAAAGRPVFGASRGSAFGPSVRPAFGPSVRPAFGPSVRPVFGPSVRPAAGIETSVIAARSRIRPWTSAAPRAPSISVTPHRCARGVAILDSCTMVSGPRKNAPVQMLRVHRCSDMISGKCRGSPSDSVRSSSSSLSE